MLLALGSGDGETDEAYQKLTTEWLASLAGLVLGAGV